MDLSLYILTDKDLSMGRSDEEVVSEAISGGATIIQYRHKAGGARQMMDEAIRLRDVCRESSVPFIVNDRLDVALASEADGVHLGQDDLDAASARKIAGPGFIIGASVRTPEECVRAEDSGADYLAANGIFFTSTKTDFGEPLGIEGLRELCGTTKLPIVAIGGINSRNAADVIKAGADGIAVISYVVSHEDIKGRCASLIESIGEGRRTR